MVYAKEGCRTFSHTQESILRFEQEATIRYWGRMTWLRGTAILIWGKHNCNNDPVALLCLSGDMEGRAGAYTIAFSCVF